MNPAPPVTKQTRDISHPVKLNAFAAPTVWCHGETVVNRIDRVGDCVYGSPSPNPGSLYQTCGGRCKLPGCSITIAMAVGRNMIGPARGVLWHFAGENRRGSVPRSRRRRGGGDCAVTGRARGPKGARNGERGTAIEHPNSIAISLNGGCRLSTPSATKPKSRPNRRAASRRAASQNGQSGASSPAPTTQAPGCRCPGLIATRIDTADETGLTETRPAGLTVRRGDRRTSAH